MRNESEPNHVLALDGLRGLAILLVLLRHFGFSAGPDQPGWIRGLADVTNSGYIGVDLFFVLSGFLITGILYKTLAEKGYFKKFYMRRFLRIFPLYYGYIFSLLALSRPLHISWGGMLPVFLLYVQNVFLVKPYTVLWYYTGQLWSLAVEEQFYIVWPLLVFFIRDRRRLMTAAILLCFLSLIFRIVFLAHGVSGELIYTLTPCRMDSLLAGSWIALAMRSELQARLSQMARPVFLICVFLYGSSTVLSRYAARDMTYVFPTIGYSIVAIGFGSLLIMALNASSWTAGLLRGRILRWLGKYSYGIYVIHLAALHVVNGAIGRWAIAAGRLGSGHGRSCTVSVLSAALSLFLAWISYNLYEVQFIKLKKHFSYSHPPAQPVVAG